MTKRRNRLLSLLLVFVLMLSLASPALAAEETVAIDETNFPDPVFRSYVAEEIDRNHDNQLSELERMVTYISVRGDSQNNRGITTLEGIGFFPNLQYLYCDYNKLTSLDLRENPNLTDLLCSDNEITNLNVQNNPKLTKLFCNKNKLTSLDLTHNPELVSLYCSSNELEELDLSQNIYLKTVSAGFNQIRTLNLGKNRV